MRSPVTWLYASPARAKSRRSRSYTSVMVPTVLRGLRLMVFCSMAITGLRPVMASTSGRSMAPRNCRA